MNTQSLPSRGSIVSAVRTGRIGDAVGMPRATAVPPTPAISGGARVAVTSTALRNSRRIRQRAALRERIGGHQPRFVDRRNIGQRVERQAEPIGESPGIRNRRRRRNCHSSLIQPARACAAQRCTGST